MQTETLNQKTNVKPNILQMVVAGIMAAIMLVSGFFISLFLLATSIILLPFAMFKINKLRQRFEENLDTMYNSNASDANGRDENVIEGEYTVTENVTEKQG